MSEKKRVVKVYCPICDEDFFDVISLRPVPLLAGPSLILSGATKTMLVYHRKCGNYIRVLLEEAEAERESAKQSQVELAPMVARNEELASARDVLIVEMAKEQAVKVFDVLNEGAKQLMKAGSLLLAVYAFSLENFVDIDNLTPMRRVLCTTPLIGLLVSLLVSLLVVLFPWGHRIIIGVPDEAEIAVRSIRRTKMWGLGIATGFFVAAVILGVLGMFAG
jgi:hypothetical protein